MGKKPAGYQQFLNHASASYGTDPGVLDGIARLESGYRTGVVNDWDSNAKAGIPSKGMMQFIEPTFNSYAREARKANPKAWRGVPLKWGDWRAQMLATSWAVKNGKGSAWATYDRAKQGATGKIPKGSGWEAPTTARVVATSGVSGLDDRKSAALKMVFKDNPFMLSLMDKVSAGAGNVDIARPTGGVRQASAGGGDRGALVNTALAEVGKTANDAMRYIKAAGGTGYEPWCGDFVQWVFKQRGMKPPPARSVPNLLSWAKKNQKLVKNPRPGDMVIFDWNNDGTPDHVELVRRRIKGGVATIGGNTSGPKSGKQVAAKDRTSNIMGYISGF